MIAALYAAIVVVTLAIEGQMISRLGPGGVDIPPRRSEAASDAERALKSIAEILTAHAAPHQSAGAKNQMNGERLRVEQEGD